MNLRPTTIRVLTCLRTRAERSVADIRQRDIIVEARVSYGSMHAALRKLEEVGLIETVRTGSDRREVRYRLKKAGT